MYKLGLIGNCQISALISISGCIEWLCLPRPDSEPVFGKLLDPEGGSFSITFPNEQASVERQYYVENTNILITELSASDGSKFRITDFCPRFYQFGRIYRPCSLFRMVEPMVGTPVIKVNCSPINGWKKEKIKSHHGNSHLKYDYSDEKLRLTTNMPLTYLEEGTTFALSEKMYFALTWESNVEEDLPSMCERFFIHTKQYWETWVKHCNIPSMFQKETIRSALALKLHCYEDTGAILAALTTSLPEEIGGVRNWDYRYCWPRDSFFVLNALHSLGHFEEMEGFVKFLLNIAQRQADVRESLAPVYTLGQTLPLPENTHDNWTGYKNSAPVRSHNQAAEHVQNDIYGEMILTLTPIYFDERFVHLRSKELNDLLIRLARLCESSISVPDAGLWEVRNCSQKHTFTHLMCWAGLERISRLGESITSQLNFDIADAMERARQVIETATLDDILRNGTADTSLDASLLLAPILRFPSDKVCRKTVEEIYKNLTHSGDDPAAFFYRYKRGDDFGNPKSAFVICSFWMAQALAKQGDTQRGIDILNSVIKVASNHVGLLSEHFDLVTGEQLGNFPQAYSHVGLINAAFAVSASWHNIL